MQRIEIEEGKWSDDDEDVSDEERKFNGLHSFYPEAWPANSARPPFHTDEMNKLRELGGNAEKIDKCKSYNFSRRFFPCHYFDYIFGSSTGA